MKAKFLSLFTLALVLCLASCSKSREYTEYLNDDMLTVSSLNVVDLLENAGFGLSEDKVTLPDGLKSIGSDPTLQSLLKVKGVDPRQVILALDDTDTNDGVVIAKLTDAAKFVEYITSDLGFAKDKSANGVDYYSKDNNSIAIDGNLALLPFTDEDKAEAMLDNLREEAAAKPIATWKVNALNEGKTLCALVSMSPIIDMAKSDEQVQTMLSSYTDLEKAEGGMMVVKGSLKDQKCEVRTFVADAKGDKIVSDVAVAPFDKSVLKYSTAEDILIAVTNLPDNQDWQKMLTNSIKKVVPNFDEKYAQLYENLKGSLMVAFGYKSISSLMATSDFHAVAVLPTAEGKTQETFDNWCEIARSLNLPITVAANTASLSLDDVRVFLTTRDNNLILTTNPAVPTTGDPNIPASEFGNYPGQMIVKIPSHNPGITMFDLPFSLSINVYSQDSEGIIIAEMGDTNGKFLENIINLINL